jgi:hypothetical protein
MMFNPTPIAHALALQSRLNAEVAAREAERDRRQAEWNALHYEILQRLALEVSRGSIDSQNLLLRVESLAAKVDFNERRVRSMEGTQVRVRPQEAVQPAQAVASGASESAAASPPVVAAAQPAEPSRRRRRRRRGRRGPGVGVPAEPSVAASLAPGGAATEDDGEIDEGFEEESASEPIDTMEPPAASEPIALSPAVAPSESIAPLAPIPSSEPTTFEPPTASFEPHPSEPMISSEPAAVEPIVSQSGARHEEPAPPGESDHRDE